MEERGFLERHFDKTDRRQIRIILTKKAHALSEKYNEVSDEMGEFFYKGFTDEEIVLFEKTLERILSNLTNERG